MMIPVARAGSESPRSARSRAIPRARRGLLHQLTDSPSRTGNGASTSRAKSATRSLIAAVNIMTERPGAQNLASNQRYVQGAARAATTVRGHTHGSAAAESLPAAAARGLGSPPPPPPPLATAALLATTKARVGGR